LRSKGREGGEEEKGGNKYDSSCLRQLCNIAVREQVTFLVQAIDLIFLIFLG
jgi:hypothetical protein